MLGNDVRSVLKNGAHLLGVNWIENALRAVYIAVLARYLGPSLYGQWAYGIAAYVLVMGLIGFGFETLIALRLGRDKCDAADFLGLTVTLRLALLILAAAGLSAYTLTAESDPLSRLVLLALIPALIGRGLAVWARACFLGYERVGAYWRIVTFLRGAEAGCGILYLVSGGGLLGVIILHSLSWICEAAIGLWRVRSRLTAYTLRFAWRQAIEFLKQGAVLGLAAGAYTWLAAGPVIILRHAGGNMAQVGQFAIISNVTMILVGSGQAFFGAALPVLSRSAERSDPRVAAYGRLIALTISGVAVGSAGLGWLFGPSIAEWALGPTYSAAGGLLGLFLVIGGLILAPTGYAQTLLLFGRRWPSALASLAAGMVLAAALPTAIAAWSIQGALFATAGAWLLRAAILIGWGVRFVAHLPQKEN
jgi:O-antigen/teichoic acid export membrane protein